MIMIYCCSCSSEKNKKDTNSTIENDIPSKEINTNDVGFKKEGMTKHSDFLLFWNDFKTAVEKGEKSKVIAMIQFPFVDHFNEVYAPEKQLTFQTAEEFKNNYDLVFNDDVIAAIKNNKYRGYEDEKDLQENDVIETLGLYLVETKEGYPDLEIDKPNGYYQIIGITYYP